MSTKAAALATLVLITAGCAPGVMETSSDDSSPYPIPEQVVAIAGPGQNLMTARLDPADQCYWYDHAGPVETTLVPLRAANGNHICNARPT